VSTGKAKFQGAPRPMTDTARFHHLLRSRLKGHEGKYFLISPEKGGNQKSTGLRQLMDAAKRLCFYRSMFSASSAALRETLCF
jgi:hypothetical protein